MSAGYRCRRASVGDCLSTGALRPRRSSLVDQTVGEEDACASLDWEPQRHCDGRRYFNGRWWPGEKESKAEREKQHGQAGDWLPDRNWRGRAHVYRRPRVEAGSRVLYKTGTGTCITGRSMTVTTCRCRRTSGSFCGDRSEMAASATRPTSRIRVQMLFPFAGEQRVAHPNLAPDQSAALEASWLRGISPCMGFLQEVSASERTQMNDAKSTM